jgi:hypothetical protein
MTQQAIARQPDETICFRCNTVVKRDVRLCPQCGGRIETGLAAHAAPAAFRPAQAGIAAVEEEDVVGVGRYVLNFFLAGLIGLALTYFLRRNGWMATWISAGFFVLAVVVLVMSAAQGA